MTLLTRVGLHYAGDVRDGQSVIDESLATALEPRPETEALVRT